MRSAISGLWKDKIPSKIRMSAKGILGQKMRYQRKKQTGPIHELGVFGPPMGGKIVDGHLNRLAVFQP